MSHVWIGEERMLPNVGHFREGDPFPPNDADLCAQMVAQGLIEEVPPAAEPDIIIEEE